MASKLVLVGVVCWAALAVPHELHAQTPVAPAAAPAAPAPTPAGGATVHLKNGGLVRGELIELQPGKVARVKLADGTVRDVPWAELDRVDDPSLPPAPPPQAAPTPTLPAPENGAAPGAAATAPALAAATVPPADAGELTRLRAERDDIDNTGPAVMMILGGGAFLVFGVPGILLLAVGQACDDTTLDGERDCTNVTGAGAVLTVIGVAGGGVAIWGLIKVGHNREHRNQLEERIRELKGNQAGLTLDLLPRRDGAGLGLTLRM